MAITTITQLTGALATPLDASADMAIASGGAAVAGTMMFADIQKAAGAEMYVNEYGAANAFRVVEGGANAAGTGTATEILQFEAVTDPVTGEVMGTNVVKFPSQTTAAGTVKEGALAGQVPIGTVAAGLAIGAGIGLKEAANHRQFWNDLVTIGDGINTPEQTVQVIWRMLEDGSIQSYCDKRTADRLIQNFYEMEAFNVVDSIEVNVDHTGLQPVAIGGLEPGYAAKACELADVGIPSASIAYDMAHSHYPNANTIMVECNHNTVTGYTTIGMYCYDLPGGNLNVLSDSQGFYVDVPSSYYKGIGTFNYDVDGTLMSYSFQDGQGIGGIRIGSSVRTTATNKISLISNVGSTYKYKNPNVIYNGTDLLPPSDPSQFWNTFSQWLTNAFQQPGYNPLNNAIVPTTWLPFTFPNINWQLDPAVGVQTEVWPGIFQLPDPFTDPSAQPAPDYDPWLWRAIGDYIVPHIDIPYPKPTPFDDMPQVDPVKPNPIGSTPDIIAPSSGLSNALFTVYNPTQAQVNALGAYLWTQNIIELIAQFFQNPLDAIISLHMVYCTPATGSPKNIKLGYLDSGVAADVVTSQYVEIACGDVNIPELYKNALDYNNVDIQIFLPFIGFRALNNKEVMGATLRVIYKVDVYTGICLASIYVIRPGVSQLLYTFEGNCAIDIPLTSADRSRLVSGLITAGVSAVTGNPAGVAGGLASVHASIERSGSFSGNAGAMGVKKPYVVIKRAISAQATNYAKQYGYPLNKSARLGSFSGFTRVESVHVDIPGATDTEKRMIESMLKNGIII